MSDATIEHLPSNARTKNIVDILERDGGVILDQVVDTATLKKLQAELQPYKRRTRALMISQGGKQRG